MSVISRAKELYRDGGPVSILKGSYRFIYWKLHSVFPWTMYIRELKNRIYKKTDAMRLTSPDSVYGESYYSKRRGDGWRADAHQIASVLDDQFDPSSVIDFGCAIGQHLEYFHSKDIEIHGVEGSSKALAHAVIPQDYLEQYDLRDRYIPNQQYELAICIELAEHLGEPYADTLVKSLTESAPIIFFTAATPGQSGTHHVNEKPRSYWIEKFENHGFVYDEVVTEEIKDQLSLTKTTEVPNNVFLFKSES